MEAHPDIARAFAKGSKEHVTRFWREAEKELNSAGPPIKNIMELKKVWVDQKKYMRQKAAQNLKSQKGTGGGPNTQHIFSAIEEGIYQLIGMKESVEGVAAKTFGLRLSSFVDETVPETILLTDNSDTDNDLPVPVEENGDFGCSKSSVPKRAISKSLPKKYSPSDALEEELRIQKELCGTVKKVVQDFKKQRHSTRKISRYLDRLYDLQKNHFMIVEDFKKKKFEEIKRHHLSMEKIRLQEAEDTKGKKRRLLDKEDLNE